MVRWIFLWLSIFGIAAGPASAQKIDAWSEAVVSVRDLEDASRLFIDYGEWKIISEAAMDDSELSYWKLPEEVTGRYRLICAPEAETGCIRFIALKNAGVQKPIRPAARPWDTGGIFSLMIRSDDVDALFDKALAMGWWAESEPYRFSFGASDLNNVVLRGPHGINIAVYERIKPAFTAFPIGKMSQTFNAMRMVRDQKASLKFYREKLGLGLLFDADYLDPEPTMSNFSVPINLSTSIPRRAAVVHHGPGETGRMELMQFVGFEGRDFAKRASLPSLGIISVRYPVTGLADYREQLIKRRVPIAYEANRVAVDKIGVLNLLAVRDPDGNLTEFYEEPSEI
ncbi:MAG: VOC family protein [Sphingorhabdus sp.]